MFERGEPYFVRRQQDLLTTARTLDLQPGDLLHHPANRAPWRTGGSRGDQRQRLLIDFHIMLNGAPNPYICRTTLRERQGWPRRSARVLAEHHPRLLAGAVLVRHRRFDRALQPASSWASRSLNEYVWGRPDRRVHDQPPVGPGRDAQVSPTSMAIELRNPPGGVGGATARASARMASTISGEAGARPAAR